MHVDIRKETNSVPLKSMAPGQLFQMRNKFITCVCVISGGELYPKENSAWPVVVIGDSSKKDPTYTGHIFIADKNESVIPLVPIGEHQFCASPIAN